MLRSVVLVPNQESTKTLSHPFYSKINFHSLSKLSIRTMTQYNKQLFGGCIIKFELRPVDRSTIDLLNKIISNTCRLLQSHSRFAAIHYYISLCNTPLIRAKLRNSSQPLLWLCQLNYVTIVSCYSITMTHVWFRINLPFPDRMSAISRYTSKWKDISETL